MDRVIKMNQYDKMNGMVYTEPVFRSTWPFMKSSSLYEKEFDVLKLFKFYEHYFLEVEKGKLEVTTFV